MYHNRPWKNIQLSQIQLSVRQAKSKAVVRTTSIAFGLFAVTPESLNLGK
jgi:hypothetical protein